MNKKGNIYALLILVIIAITVIFGALFVALGSGVLTYTSDTITEVTNSLGMAGDSNLSYYSEVSISTMNDSIQMLSWASGVIIIFMFLAIIIFAGTIRLNPNGFLIGFYLILVIILIIGSMIVSNTYEEFLNNGDVISVELQGQTMANFLVLYLPMIITIMSFVGGIIIFSGLGEEQF